MGYGDVIAANDGERALCLLGMLIGVTGFGYTVGNVSIIMESFNLHDSMKLSRMNELRAYISCRKYENCSYYHFMTHHTYSVGSA